MTPSIPTDPILQKLVETAKSDLAQRLAVPVDTIVLVEAASVVWPDDSLGCPQLEKAYTQITIPGYWILLEASGSQYPYHSDTSTQVIFCQEESFPLFPVKPGEIDDGQPWMR